MFRRYRRTPRDCTNVHVSDEGQPLKIVDRLSKNKLIGIDNGHERRRIEVRIISQMVGQTPWVHGARAVKFKRKKIPTLFYYLAEFF